MENNQAAGMICYFGDSLHNIHIFSDPDNNDRINIQFGAELMNRIDFHYMDIGVQEHTISIPAKDALKRELDFALQEHLTQSTEEQNELE